MAQARVHVLQNNFTSGEFSEDVILRSDLQRYNSALAVGENIILLPQGGFIGRYGTRFVAKVKDRTKTTRLIPFNVADGLEYVLEAGENYFRFYTLSGRIQETPQAITNCVDNGGGLIRVTVTTHGYSTGDYVNIQDVVGTTEANGDWQITVIDANTFDLDSSTFTNTYVSGGTASKIVHISTPYLEADIPNLQFTNFEGVLYIVHPLHEPATLTRTDDLNWTLADITFIDGPYFDENTGPITITPSATTGSITLTASAALWTANHVGSLWRIKVSTTYGYVKITAFTSSTSVNADVINTLDGTTATTAWREGLWSNERGFPRTVTVYEQRLVFDGGTAKRQTVVGSSAANVIDMTPGANPSDSYVFNIGGRDLSNIQWLAPTSKALMAGTSRIEFALRDADGKTISPDNPPLTRPETFYGATDVTPAELDQGVIFVQRNRRKIREFAFSFERDGFSAEDITILANHITESGVLEMSSMPEPVNIVWSVRADGVLAVLTRLREQNITAWVRHFTADGNDFYESVATIPHPDGDRDQTWVIVQRQVNGVAERYVEWFDDTLHLDSALSLDATGSPTTTVSNLEHLEGRTVTPVGDGAVYPNEVVTNGEITLDGPAAELIDVGVSFTCKAIPLSPEAELADGTTHGLPRRISRVIVFLRDTVGLSINGEFIPFRDSSDPMTAAVQPFTGFKRVLNLGYSKGGFDSGVTIEQTQPLPFKVLAVIFTVSFGDS